MQAGLSSNKLTREHKKAIGFLSIGTFLEYFDLMLYVHMAVLLNELFFPKTDPFTASLISASMFCSIYVFRPFGALLLGYIGDNIGRKATVVITTIMMAVSCLVIANLPTYAQIGITASWVMIICRVVQGLSSMGESIGAQIYLTEVTRPPIQYPIVCLIPVSIAMGSFVSLGVSKIITSGAINWRAGFWIGACIAIIGMFARMLLKETQEFVEAKSRAKNLSKQLLKNIDQSNLGNEFTGDILNVKLPFQWIRSLSMFSMQAAWPLCFYLIYIYSSIIYKNFFGLTPAEIISNNFMVSIVQFIGISVITFLSYYIYPLKIIRVKLVLSHLIFKLVKYGRILNFRYN